MYNRYIPNPDGTYQRQRVFDSEQPIEAKIVREAAAETPDCSGPEPGPLPAPPAGEPGCKTVTTTRPSGGRGSLSIDDLLVLAILLLLLLEEEDDQMMIVLAILAFFLL